MKNLLFLLLLTGCMSTSKLETNLNSWIGHPEKELIFVWGEPDKVLDMDDGSYIFQYVFDKEYTVPGSTASIGNASGGFSTYQDPRTYTWKAYRYFFLDSTHIIYKWKYQGK